MRNKKKGFSLIELLIVVAIILIIAAIAIPNLLKSRISANEASAVGAVRTIGTSEITYQMGNGKFGTLTDLNGVELIDSVLGAGKKSGYDFAASLVGTTDFLATATPTTYNSTGIRAFCIAQENVVRYKSDGSSALTVCDTTISPLGK